METFRSRLFAEYGELQKRIEKLKNFVLNSDYDALHDIDRKDLKEQLGHMEAYCAVLSRRVSRQCGDA